MTTLLITATAFDDKTVLAYSFNYADGSFSRIHQCGASAQDWIYLLHYLPIFGYDFDAVRLSVIDRRPGTRATSRCCGHSLTGSQHV